MMGTQETHRIAIGDKILADIAITLQMHHWEWFRNRIMIHFTNIHHILLFSYRDFTEREPAISVMANTTAITMTPMYTYHPAFHDCKARTLNTKTMALTTPKPMTTKDSLMGNPSPISSLDACMQSMNMPSDSDASRIANATMMLMISSHVLVSSNNYIPPFDKSQRTCGILHVMNTEHREPP
jgi:hypothetical protein